MAEMDNKKEKLMERGVQALEAIAKEIQTGAIKVSIETYLVSALEQLAGELKSARKAQMFLRMKAAPPPKEDDLEK